MATGGAWEQRLNAVRRRLRQVAQPIPAPPSSPASGPKPGPGPEAILANPYVTAKLLSPARGDILVRKPPALTRSADLTAVDGGLPVPPNLYWEGYGPDAAAYLASGRKHTERMLSILGAAGAGPEGFDRVLDFGCAAGRMLRWFPRAENSERWGCDIKGETIAWCQQHLSPLLFLATTTLPHLPFEDHYFDLVYCGSVFTHIIDLPDAWFLELRRIIRPGGYGYVTVFDRHALDLVLEPSDRVPAGPAWFADQMRAFDRRTGAFMTDFAYFSVDEGPQWEGMPVPQVCYDIDFLVNKWSRLVDVVSVNEEAYAYQTAVLFRR